MFQRDYILRLIDMAAQAIARAMRLLVQQKPEAAEEQLNAGYSALPIDRELLLLLDVESLRQHFGDDTLMLTAAGLLLCDAEIQVHKGAARAAVRRLKAARRMLDATPDAALQADLERVAKLVEAAQ